MNEKSLDYFRSLFNSSKDAISFVDLNGVFQDVNKAFTDLTQYSKKELLLNKDYNQITPEEYFEVESHLVERMLDTRESVKYEKEYIKKNGSRVPIELNAFTLTDHKGEPIGFGAQIRDLTDNLKQEELQKDENSYLDLLESANEAVCEIDNLGNVLYVSPNSTDILSCNTPDLKGKNIFNFIHDKDLLLFRSALIKSFNTFSTQVVTFRMRFMDDDWQMMEARIKPFNIPDNQKRSILLLKNRTVDNSSRHSLKVRTDELEALNKDLELKKQDLDILYSITKAVHESINIEDVYRISMDRIINLDNVDMVFVYIVDRKRNEAVLKQSRNVPEEYIRKVSSIPYPAGLTWHIIRTGEMLNIDDIQNNDIIGPAGKSLGHHGVLGIPLSNRCEIYGVIYFASYKNRRFNSKEVNLLSSISDHISIALAKANLYKELNKKNRYENIINTVTRSIHKSINLQEVLNNAVTSIKENIVNADRAAIYFIHDNKAVLKTPKKNERIYKEEITDFNGLTWNTINSGQVKYIDGLENKPSIDFTRYKCRMNSYLGLPIRSERKILGVLNIASTTSNAFDEDELELFKIIVNQIEIAIKNAKMVEALEKSEKNYRDLFENIPTGIYRKDSKGRIIMANPAFVKMLGYSSFEEMSAYDLKREKFDPNFNKGKFGKKVKEYSDSFGLDLESTWKRIDGTLFEVLENVKAVYGKTGEISFFEGTVQDITERKRAETELRYSKQRLRDLATHLQTIREEERKKIAREIHDEFAQLLTGMMISLSILKKSLNQYLEGYDYQEIIGEIDDISLQVKNAVQVAKKITGKLRPRILDDAGIEAAIQWQIDIVRSRSDMDIRFYTNIDHGRVDQDLQTALFRIFQESMTNILRHAQASKVRVSLRKKNKYILLRVVDNGIGISEKTINDSVSFGILGIKERVIPFNGEVEILGKQGKGTCVEVKIPLS